ncbi:hypothetical protein [Frigoriglobus tundricola]|uniref:DUF4864 domain-containing protein n=1 Tax=Frigoriglobus tundricola TaxID=2774151 RepID=A0A6M5Z3Z1_9BACT|nr:hypothetical protein [Frigoriglobus tundricola]QJX00152.1 hypothetical protein FTUN_7776 [Frigoriglobus tundricola]
MTRSVLFAGLLGGVLGAVIAFGLTRTFPFPVPPPPVPAPRPSDARPSAARQYTDDLIALLRAGNNEAFLKGVRQAFPVPDERFDVEVRVPLLKQRQLWEQEYGKGSDFEFIRETALGPNLVRCAYLEKFPRGCVVWYIVVYNGPTGWQVLAFNQLSLEAAFHLLN